MRGIIMNKNMNVDTSQLMSTDEVRTAIEMAYPDIYSRRISFVDSANRAYRKTVLINFKTGEVLDSKDNFSNKKNSIVKSNITIEQINTKNTYREIRYEVYSYIRAFIVNNNLVVGRWILNNPFNQGVNFFNRNGAPIDINTLRKFNLIDEEYTGPELMRLKIEDNVFLESMVMITPDKITLSWTRDLRPYGIDAICSDNIYSNMISFEKMHKIPNYKEYLRQLFKWGFIGSNTYSVLIENDDIYHFLRTPDLIKKNGKNQKFIDALCDNNFSEHNPSGNIGELVCFVDKVNTEWSVLRWYLIYNTNESKEVIRLFVNKTEQRLCRINRKDEWVQYSGKLVANSFKADRVILQTDDVLDGTKMEYFKSIYNDLSAPGAALYMFSTYPEFEKLYKVGFHSICNLYLASKKPGKWTDYITRYLGRVDFSEKNFFNAIGLNSYQTQKITKFYESKYTEALDALDDDYNYGYSAFYFPYTLVQKMKRVFNSDKLNHIDNNTFDVVMALIIDNANQIYGFVDTLQQTLLLYPQNGIKYIQNILNIQSSNSRGAQVIATPAGYMNVRKGAFTIYQDVLRMIYNGMYNTTIKPNVNTVEELAALHDLLVDITNTEARRNQKRMASEMAEKFKARMPIWKQWEYDEHEKYSVIAPSAPIEIAEEGIELHHCVGSYIRDVAYGNTNILFIREKTNLSKPFFTVEIDKNNKVRQIHGFGNRNVSTEPGLQDFIDKWGAAKKLTGYKHANRILAVGG